MAVKTSAAGVAGVDVVNTLSSGAVALVPHSVAVVLDAAVVGDGDARSSVLSSDTSVALVLAGRARDDTAATRSVDKGASGVVVAELGTTVARTNADLTVGVLSGE